MEINELTGIVLDACIKIRREIGPGCFVKVYEETLYMNCIREKSLLKDSF